MSLVEEDLAVYYPSIQIHPHPVKVPIPRQDPPSAEIDEVWLAKAGYEDMGGFRRWYGFQANEASDALTLVRHFKEYPTKHHPGWLQLSGIHFPQQLSDSDWLSRAGYRGMADFMDFWGVELEEIAQALLDRFRDRHRMVWDADARKMYENLPPKIRGDELVDCSAVRKDEFDEVNERGFVKPPERMTADEIRQAMAFHERQRHLNYRDLKKMARDKVLHSLPEFLGKMDINDIPVCEHCTTELGMTDR